MAEPRAAPYVFVSYASADRERMLPVVEALERAKVPVWIDRKGIHGGAALPVDPDPDPRARQHIDQRQDALAIGAGVGDEDVGRIGAVLHGDPRRVYPC